mmetsp:Transcript_2000/g.3049  ORF Transcript_2000/g.3049 Transcript_2000/m.3049 type:complete len:459 (-) Transcript_2000:517-1893(-)|eukprot:CAMPEP_0184339940 /NCGR_PEP_ID=MMETSP1089-20130417/8623_1 /TAXON_ID=38269 ORGANISM="Gloeochaete wittrockiana, Strain SAG46.84" /NCGR_SAMPLE_ID=MMETSP1089 /ASSEMBLY_ACC=CAM_ASM_000445 /LENGTH=458 /DNA_ID=CAMNT_0026667485 /DNA_START=75 /DNA_END=1451 /DNA_ORIENTATION=-
MAWRKTNPTVRTGFILEVDSDEKESELVTIFDWQNFPCPLRPARRYMLIVLFEDINQFTDETAALRKVYPDAIAWNIKHLGPKKVKVSKDPTKLKGSANKLSGYVNKPICVALDLSKGDDVEDHDPMWTLFKEATEAGMVASIFDYESDAQIVCTVNGASVDADNGETNLSVEESMHDLWAKLQVAGLPVKIETTKFQDFSAIPFPFYKDPFAATSRQLGWGIPALKLFEILDGRKIPEQGLAAQEIDSFEYGQLKLIRLYCKVRQHLRKKIRKESTLAEICKREKEEDEKTNSTSTTTVTNIATTTPSTTTTTTTTSTTTTTTTTTTSYTTTTTTTTVTPLSASPSPSGTPLPSLSGVPGQSPFIHTIVRKPTPSTHRKPFQKKIKASNSSEEKGLSTKSPDSKIEEKVLTSKISLAQVTVDTFAENSRGPSQKPAEDKDKNSEEEEEDEDDSNGDL